MKNLSVDGSEDTFQCDNQFAIADVSVCPFPTWPQISKLEELYCHQFRLYDVAPLFTADSISVVGPFLLLPRLTKHVFLFLLFLKLLRWRSGMLYVLLFQSHIFVCDYVCGKNHHTILYFRSGGREVDLSFSSSFRHNPTGYILRPAIRVRRIANKNDSSLCFLSGSNASVFRDKPTVSYSIGFCLIILFDLACIIPIIAGMCLISFSGPRGD